MKASPYLRKERLSGETRFKHMKYPCVTGHTQRGGQLLLDLHCLQGE